MATLYLPTCRRRQADLAEAEKGARRARRAGRHAAAAAARLAHGLSPEIALDLPEALNPLIGRQQVGRGGAIESSEVVPDHAYHTTCIVWREAGTWLLLLLVGLVPTAALCSFFGETEWLLVQCNKHGAEDYSTGMSRAVSVCHLHLLASPEDHENAAGAFNNGVVCEA